MKATIKCNGQEKEIELTDEQVREFGFKESKVWKPKYGEKYYSILSGEIYDIKFENSDECNGDYEIGNCYQTYEEAKYERDCQIYLMKYKRWLDEHNEPIDWSNGKQKKWYAYYVHNSKKIMANYYFVNQHQGTLYATSPQIINDFINEIGDENFKKYILRVKED